MTEGSTTQRPTLLGRPPRVGAGAAAALALLLALVAAATACRPAQTTEEQPLAVVASTTLLADMLRAIAPEGTHVSSLVAPGGDPHLYQPVPSDARAIATASAVVRNGLHLEGWIDDLLRNAPSGAAIITAAGDLGAVVDPVSGAPDPHFWFDARLWAAAARHVGDELAMAAPFAADAAGIRARAAAYAAAAEEIDAWARDCIASIPAGSRVLITSHDAFRYYGRAYGIEVFAPQGISTEQEASHRDVAAIIDRVRAHSLPAVFVETSVNRALVEQVARETGAQALGPLYSDSVGAPGSGADSWRGAFVANTMTVANGLGGQCTAPAAP